MGCNVGGGIGGANATELLLHPIEMDRLELQHGVYPSLWSLHDQADPDGQHLFVNKVDAEANDITWLLAAMEDLSGSPQFQLGHKACGHERDVKRDAIMSSVVDGKVRVFEGDQELGILGERAVSGHLVALDPEPHAASIQAIEDCTLLRLEGELLCELMAGNKKVTRGIIHVLCDYARQNQVRPT